MRTGHRLGLRPAQTVTQSSQSGRRLTPLPCRSSRAWPGLPAAGSSAAFLWERPQDSARFPSPSFPDSRLPFCPVTLPIASKKHEVVLNTQTFGTFNRTVLPSIKNAGHSLGNTQFLTHFCCGFILRTFLAFSPAGAFKLQIGENLWQQKEVYDE